MINFEELGVDQQILRAIKELGYYNPMPVQEKVIPYLLQDKYEDLIARAQTGTGKTAAFGVPLIQKTNSSVKQIQYLILCPTRELCLQIADDLISIAKYRREVKIAAIFGGTSIERQLAILKAGAHIISATPGRLLDLIKRKKADISGVRTVVLDEADEILNMGFRKELEAILKETPKGKNTLLFSATMSNEVREIANKYMNNPTEITIGKKNEGAENIMHLCYMVHSRDRYLALKRIVDYHPEIYGIIFCRTRKETQEIANHLVKDGYNVDALHGDLSQAQRDTVMNKFRMKNLKLLVATDVAARGLDVDDLTHIINYSLPDELNIYTHRSGRTGRAGKAGTSVVITNLTDRSKLYQIEKQINKKFIFSPVPTGREVCKKQLFYLIERLENVEVDYTQIDSFLPEINNKLEWLDRDELIKKFVSLEFNRFLDYYKNTPDLNHPEEKGKSQKSKNSAVSFNRFFINLGTTDNLNPSELIGMINDFTGIRNIEIGQIEILKNFSFFETDNHFTEKIISSFKNKIYKKRGINVEVAEMKRKSGNLKYFVKNGKPERSGKQGFSRDKFKKGRKKV